MTYSLEFHPLALKEWKKIAPSIQQQFKKKLQQRLSNPHVPASKLSGHPDTYKIKLRAVGYRLVYSVKDDVVVVYVLAVGKRENNKVYESLTSRQP
ncbi:type II toxin-antitoxin system RelE/ParE family toxin [Psychrobacter sp. Cmf 22.2]|uniref:type II toxin-antitoxin system RelE family toxin n=1 Tax=Psychrobacter sp. Cmf 22.2 TaxID=1926478 RepID=UPI000946CEED|nr:type II toxin-antitoxin system mRNA interferase toxin, RelE/StbE family [Psychrobacter sp. Cmf 22.2]OLF39565.1 addiction module toxin RelE [Psychrobacter sp. Cmf 22.2]